MARAGGPPGPKPGYPSFLDSFSERRLMISCSTRTLRPATFIRRRFRRFCSRRSAFVSGSFTKLAPPDKIWSVDYTPRQPRRNPATPHGRRAGTQGATHR